MSKPSVAPDTEVVEQNQLVPLYRVVLLDDNDHTYDYVIEMLQRIFIFSLDQAYRHAEADVGLGAIYLELHGLGIAERHLAWHGPRGNHHHGGLGLSG